MGNQVTLELLSEELKVDMELLKTMSYVIDGEDDYEDCDDEFYMTIDEELTKQTLLRLRLDWVQHVKKCLHEKSFS